MTQKRTLSMWIPVKIVYTENNSFQMAITFLTYIVTFLGQVHFTTNYFFTVHTSARRLLLQSNQFDTTVTFLEQLLFQNNYFLRIGSSLRAASMTNLFRILISTEEFLFRSKHFYKTANFAEAYSEPLQTSKIECFCVIC